jgi:uncharacterized protein YlxW (UPF0749 family)
MRATLPLLSPARPTRRALTWAALLLLFGLVVALPWTVRERVQPINRSAERETALQSLARLEAEQRGLKEQIAALRTGLAEAQKQQAMARAALTDLEAELKQQRVLAGLTPLVGPGAVVTLSDSASAAPAGTAANDYIIHDTDVRDVLNVLWAAGAEAITVNGERLVASSSVVCVGTVIIINDTRLAPPFVITAIGEPGRLVAAIDDSPQLKPLRQRAREVGVLLKHESASRVEVPAYKGTFFARQPGAL